MIIEDVLNAFKQTCHWHAPLVDGWTTRTELGLTGLPLLELFIAAERGNELGQNVGQAGVVQEPAVGT